MWNRPPKKVSFFFGFVCFFLVITNLWQDGFFRKIATARTIGLHALHNLIMRGNERKLSHSSCVVLWRLSNAKSSFQGLLFYKVMTAEFFASLVSQFGLTQVMPFPILQWEESVSFKPCCTLKARMSVESGIVLQRSSLLQSYGSRIFFTSLVSRWRPSQSHALPNFTLRGKCLIQTVSLLWGLQCLSNANRPSKVAFFSKCYVGFPQECHYGEVQQNSWPSQLYNERNCHKQAEPLIHPCLLNHYMPSIGLWFDYFKCILSNLSWVFETNPGIKL